MNQYAKTVTYFVIIIMIDMMCRYTFAMMTNHDFPVRKYKDIDVLCAQYTVQPDVNLFNLLRTRGDIAEKDFGEFLTIFKFLNPHIKHIDQISPGEHILLPLKKINPNLLPEQASGIVNIPLISIAEKPVQTSKCQNPYTIQRGDTVSKLIAFYFGEFGSESYQKGIEQFKQLNSHIIDIDQIFFGEVVCMPLSAQLVKPKLYKKSFDGSFPMPSMEYSFFSIRKPDDHLLDYFIKTMAHHLGIMVKQKGVYYFPKSNKQNITLDLHQCPLLLLPNGRRLILNLYHHISSENQAVILSFWKEALIMDFDQLFVNRLCQALVDSGIERKKQVLFQTLDAQIAVHGEWILSHPKNPSKFVCVTSIQSKDDRTSQAAIQYLFGKQILVFDWLKPENKVIIPKPNRKFPKLSKLTKDKWEDFIAQLSKELGINYTPRVPIQFSYAGFNVDTYSREMVSQDGQRLYINLGEIYGDALPIIQKNGYSIVTIQQPDHMVDALETICKTMAIPYERNPVFFAAKRANRPTVSFIIPGVYIKRPNHTILYTRVVLSDDLIQLLTEKNIEIIYLA